MDHQPEDPSAPPGPLPSMSPPPPAIPAPRPAAVYRSSEGMAATADIMFSLAVISAIALAAACWHAAGQIHHLSSPGNLWTLSDPTIHTALVWLLLAAGIFAFTWLLAQITMIAWLHRSANNSEALSPELVPRWTPGWAIGAWFIPVVNCVIPYLVMKDVWTRSEKYHRPSAWASHVIPLWVLVLVGGVLLRGLSVDATMTTSTASFLLRAASVGAIIYVLVGYLSVMLIHDLTHLQKTQRTAATAPKSPPAG